MTILAIASLCLAALPAYFYARNRSQFQALPPAEKPPTENMDRPDQLPTLSVLIPARNEEKNISPCVLALRGNAGVDYEVVILDDHSEDNTAKTIEQLKRGDPRVRMIQGKPLPAGWNGKQHACAQLAEAAQHERLLFIDADVRLAPTALARIVAELDRSDAGLISGFPRQLTESPVEWLLLPLINFLLLGFLSLRKLRRTTEPEFAAGCGQLFATTKAAYDQAGGHAAIRASRHDGVTLPRRYVASGQKIDVFDATDLAQVRMYQGAAATWQGLAKNADEGLAKPGLILPATLLLLLGQVVPVVVLLVDVFGYESSGNEGGFFPLKSPACLLFFVATLLVYLPRLDAVRRFKQPLLAAVLHPLGVVVFLMIQWSSLIGGLMGRRVEWKGRGVASEA